jgi:hypothetical protein
LRLGDLFSDLVAEGVDVAIGYDGKDRSPSHPGAKGFGCNGRVFFWLRPGLTKLLDARFANWRDGPKLPTPLRDTPGDVELLAEMKAGIERVRRHAT